MRPIDCFQRYPLFNLLPPRQLEAWLTGGLEHAFDLGQTIFQEGSAGTWAYLILAGRVRILRRLNDGRDLTVGVMGPGEVFGEYALLPPCRNTATCRAAEPSRLLRVPLLPLKPVLGAIPGLATNLKDWLRLHGFLAYLREQAFLGFMSAPSALTFLDRTQPVEFHSERTIQADGLGADRWYFLETGRVRLFPPDGVQGPFRELGPGACFGERALLVQKELPIAVALTDIRGLSLTRQAFASSSRQEWDTSLQSLEPRPCSLQSSFPWIGQREEADCGLAALAMIARHFGRQVDIDSLRAQFRVGDRGATLIELQQTGTALGFRCLALRIESERLDQIEPPAIIHQSAGHYVVLYELGADMVVIGDPATGIARLNLQAFAGTCSGNVLLVRTKP